MVTAELACISGACSFLELPARAALEDAMPSRIAAATDTSWNAHDAPELPAIALPRASQDRASEPSSSSAQADLHAAHIRVEFQADGTATEVEDDALCILQPNARSPTADRDATANSRVGAGDVGRPTQVVGTSDQLGLRCTDRRADAQATDAQGITSSLKDERPAPASNADNEPCLGDLDMHGPGCGPCWARRCRHDRRKRDQSTSKCVWNPEHQSLLPECTDANDGASQSVNSPSWACLRSIGSHDRTARPATRNAAGAPGPNRCRTGQGTGSNRGRAVSADR